MDPDKKDFLLHLYDKLWENMYSKEARLWNYLALYGAGIAITFGAGKLAGLELYALIFVLILTYWALLIVTNANWWYYRNLLMVTRVEREFESGLIGVVPKFYRENPPFQFDRLHRSTIHILLITGTLFFMKGVLEFRSVGSIVNRETVISLFVAYLIFALGPFYWLHFHEHFIRRYYESKIDLWVEAEQKNEADKRKSKEEIAKSFAEEESKTRGTFNWRWIGATAIVLGSAPLDLVAQRNTVSRSHILIVVELIQLIAVGLSIWLALNYRAQDTRLGIFSKQAGKKPWSLAVLSAGAVYCLLLLSCVVLFFVITINKSPTKLSTSGNLGDVIAGNSDSSNLALSVSNLRRKIDLQKVSFEEELQDYLSKSEAVELYLRKDDAGATFLTKTQFAECVKRLEHRLRRDAKSK